MGKVTLYIAQSADGYIAREDGSIDWLRDSADEDYGYEKFINTVDTVFLGRKTYDHIFELTEEFPYRMKDIYVVSNTREGHDDYATYLQPEQILPLVNMLKNEQNKTIWVVGGANLIHYFISAELIDEFQIFIQPTLIGKGIPLFKKNDLEKELQLTETKAYQDGMLAITYQKKEQKH
ncbi:dihydrofolate reductase [Halobacillus litoralis]|uniref:Dihydrofolate reductase n=1 Tax=Halobacillus litoralis TaxID=45668 RepID=A0A845FEN2_9BACI|nr:dihydrofolate reductase family protein [Halobacillus litoralis]MYL72086.1 dihydrofolate reductase [Halobacillus litoralis]